MITKTQTLVIIALAAVASSLLTALGLSFLIFFGGIFIFVYMMDDLNPLISGSSVGFVTGISMFFT